MNLYFHKAYKNMDSIKDICRVKFLYSSLIKIQKYTEDSSLFIPSSLFCTLLYLIRSSPSYISITSIHIL